MLYDKRESRIEYTAMKLQIIYLVDELNDKYKWPKKITVKTTKYMKTKLNNII